MKKITIFASGTGSNAQRIIDYFRHSTLIRVDSIYCNNPQAGVVSIARKEGIPLVLLEYAPFFTGDQYIKDLRQKGIDLIVLAGFLWKVPHSLLEAFPRRMINIHPALLPLHGGKGMFGLRVHEAVLAAGDSLTGITIHYLNEQYDSGEIILQRSCPVVPGESPEQLASRVHTLEYECLPRVIEQLLIPPGQA